MKINLCAALLIAIFLVTGCKKTEEEPFVGNELLTLNGNLIASDFATEVFLSDKNGNILSCKNHVGTDPLVLSNEVPMEDDYFDFSLIRTKNADLNLLWIETYPNIQQSNWNFKSEYSSVSNRPTGNVTFLADDLADDIDYALIGGGYHLSTSFNELKETGLYTTKFYLDRNFFFIRFRMKDEAQYRYAAFDNLADGDTIALDIASYPLGILEDLDANGADYFNIISMIGLLNENSFEHSASLHQQGVFHNDYVLPDGKIWYPQGVFNSIFTRFEMRKDNYDYIFENLGDPIYTYNPTPPQLTIEGDKNSFQVQTTDQTADFVSATWAVENDLGSIEWTIYHQKDDTNFYKLPDFPTCIYFDDSWFSEDDFVLKSLQSYHYENFDSYDQYIQSRYGDEDGGEGRRMVIPGGNYEKKAELY